MHARSKHEWIDWSAHSSPRGRRPARRQGALRRRHRAPRVWHAAFVRSPHPHAAIRGIGAHDALAVPGVHAVLALDDLAPVLAKRRMLRHSNSGAPLDRYWSFALADGEVSYVGEAVPIALAD